MQIVYLDSSEREKWNTFVSKDSLFALLQSWEWGEFKEKLGWNTFRIAVTRHGQIIAGAQIIIKPVIKKLISTAYVPRGPICNWSDERVVSLLLSELHQIAHRNNVVFLRIEPPVFHSPIVSQILGCHKFLPSCHTNQPRATSIIDLAPDLDSIFKQIRKKTRQYIRNSRRKGVRIRIGEPKDLPAFYHLMKVTGQRSDFSPRSFDYYESEWRTFVEKNQAVLLMAYHQDRLLAARMIFCFDKHAAEFHAGSLDDSQNLHPNYFLVWEAIKWAKAKGCRTYDLWGIPDEVGKANYEGKPVSIPDNFDGLWGVYQFKRGFSKDVTYFASAHDYISLPLVHRVITNNLFSRKMLDQFIVWGDSLKHF